MGIISQNVCSLLAMMSLPWETTTTCRWRLLREGTCGSAQETHVDGLAGDPAGRFQASGEAGVPEAPQVPIYFIITFFIVIFVFYSLLRIQ
jgi:hypothetical protein